MAEEAVIKVRLDVGQARAAQREMDAGFARSTEAAGSVGKALLGGFGALVGGGIGGFLGGMAASVSGPAMAAVSSFVNQATGISKITDRVGAAESARDKMTSALGPAAAFMDQGSLASIGKTFLQFEDVLAQASRRIEQLFRPEVLQRTDEWIPKWLQVVPNPDSLLR